MSEAELSDFEDEEPAPVVLNNSKSIPGDAEVRLAAELDRHRAEDEELRKKLDQVTKQRDEALKQLDQATRQKEEASKSREQTRSEIEAAAKLLIAGAEKLTPLIGENKFSGGFPRSSKYTGIAAICHGFCKRIEEVVEEALKQRDSAIKSKNELQVQMDHRNYEIAIEVSQLEDSVVRVKDELEKRTSELQKVTNSENELHEKLGKVRVEVEDWKKRFECKGQEVRVLESECGELKKKLEEEMRGFLATEELVASFLHKIDGKAVVSVAELPFSDFSDAGRVHGEYMRRVESLSSLLVHMKNSWEEKEEVRVKERSELEKVLQRLSGREKEAKAFVRSSLKDTRCEEEDDLQVLLSLLDVECRRLRMKSLDLERQLNDARTETEKVTKLSDLQAKELLSKASRIQELEERYGVVSENVEGLTAEIAAAEEELVRWKKAATEEAAAGVAVLQEVERCNQEIAALNQLVAHLRQSLEESNSKLQSKEEMAAAAITARNAADRSLRLADERAAELRERLEEMSRQLEDVEAQLERSRICGGKFLEIVPWFKTRLEHYKASLRQTTVVSAEMGELTEPLV